MSYHDLTVIAPCWNEEDNIHSLVQRTLATFDKAGIDGHIILVNDASTDKSWERIQDEAAKDQRVSGINHEKNRGLFQGWMTGLNAAQGNHICFIDADLQNPPEEIARLWRTMQNDSVDMVQGARSSIGRVRDIRYRLSCGLNFLLNTIFGSHSVDNKSGFVLAPREVLKDALSYRYHYSYPQSFVRIGAEAKGYSIKEIETLFEARRVGKSFLADFPAKTILACLMDLAIGFWEFRLLRHPQDSLERFMRDHPPLREPTPYSGWRKMTLALYFATTPLHKWMITSNFGRIFHSLRRSQYLSRTDIQAYQLHRLRRVTRHAYNHCPYYRQRFDEAGIRPEDIRTLADIAKLPLLAKDDVRKNLHFDMFADNHDKSDMLRISTSGSTGQPFVCYADRRQLELRAATTMRAAEWTGWRFGDRQARLWHQTIGMSKLQVVREKIDALFMRRIFVPAFEIRENNIRGFIAKIRDHRPVLVDGYAESFNFLAHYAKENDIPGFRPKAIMSSAQILPDQVRKIIEDRFATKVFDKYGAREFSGIAYEDTSHDGHIVMAESYIVEILKDGRPALPGETGEVIVTDLTNMHVPLIRYRLGDLATAIDDSMPSASGCQFPRIGRIQGRSQAIIICPNGAWIPGSLFGHYFKDHDNVVAQYQVVQEERGSMILKIVPGPQYSEHTLEAVVSGLRPYVGEAMNIILEKVDNIPLVKTGKRTGVVSKLGLDFQKLSEETSEGDEMLSEIHLEKRYASGN
jgi:phenylacetate-CoA ligase